MQFLAALSSSRSLVVRRLVRPSVGPSVGELCEKVTFRILNGNLNVPTYATVVTVVTVATVSTVVRVVRVVRVVTVVTEVINFQVNFFE